MQRKVNRLLLLMIGTALAACSSTSEQGSSGTETEAEIIPSTVQPPPPEPEPVQYTEADLDVGDLGPVDYSDETETYSEEVLDSGDSGVSEPEEYYQYSDETIEYSEEVDTTMDSGISGPSDAAVEPPQEQLEFPVTTYTYEEEQAPVTAEAPVTIEQEQLEFPVTSYEVGEEPEIGDLGAVDQPTETLSYAEEYVPDTGPGVAEPEEFEMEEEIGELGPVDTSDEVMVFPEETVYQEESVGDVTTYQSVTVNAEARPLFAFDKSNVQSDEQYKLEGFVSELSGAEFETVWVVGHADRIGTVEYNQGLSERRANAVKAFLVRLGIADDKINTSGRSELMPVTTEAECNGMRGNALIECFQPDRRVEVSVSAEVVQEVMN